LFPHGELQLEQCLETTLLTNNHLLNTSSLYQIYYLFSLSLIFKTQKQLLNVILMRFTAQPARMRKYINVPAILDIILHYHENNNITDSEFEELREIQMTILKYLIYFNIF
jgi:hypothetical protein